MKEMMETGSIVTMLLDAIITSRFDLMLFAIGLMGYFILVSSRTAKETYKKVDITFETPQVIDADQGADAACTRLSRALESMEDCSTDVQLATTQMDAFLEDYPQHPFTSREIQTVLGFCSKSLADKGLADRLLELMKPTEEWDGLCPFIRFYLDTEQSEKACDVFELNYATFFDIELDEDMEWPLLMAASACGRHSLAEHLLQTSQSDYAKPVVSIQQWWRRSSGKLGETRVAQMGDVLNRLSNIFNELHPFEEEHSDGESTCFLGDDSDGEESDSDSAWEESY